MNHKCNRSNFVKNILDIVDSSSISDSTKKKKEVVSKLLKYTAQQDHTNNTGLQKKMTKMPAT